ncbi:hypothetical protein [Nesterenkonia ebinurensis]|uniref:hypothetical protein n=1 Tax=Nesterenkonia ebinurensis TaxID=2608252 RepID=UPI00168BAF4C|nr:hypothetical protein [Nesterenkonia ebinurensis]
MSIEVGEDDQRTGNGSTATVPAHTVDRFDNMAAMIPEIVCNHAFHLHPRFRHHETGPMLGIAG